MIPKLHYISEGRSPKEHLENIQKACSSGIELVQLHLTAVSEEKLLKLAQEVREITSYFQTRLIITDHYKIARTIKADGVHIENEDVCPTSARMHAYTWQTISGMAHTLQDCETLLSKGVDYLYLGPFKTEITKDSKKPVLGLKGYTLITEALKTETPIIGFGGITTDDVKDILETGVSGIAVSKDITRNFDSIRVFSKLLNASSTEEQRHTFKKT